MNKTHVGDNIQAGWKLFRHWVGRTQEFVLRKPFHEFDIFRCVFRHDSIVSP